MGFIEVHWGVLIGAGKNFMDTNSDGKIDKEDLKNAWRRLRNMLSHGLPNASGFTLGFALGMKYV